MTKPDTDVLIIGGGLMGAGFAREIREKDPSVRITIVETGPVIGAVPGQHLHDTEDEELWGRYNARVKAGNQALYVGAETLPEIGPVTPQTPGGMYHLPSFGEDAADFPSSAIGWNSGGMGVHWSAATPPPYGSEVFDFVDPAEWSADLERAQQLLHVHPDPYGSSAVGKLVADLLDEAFGAYSDPGRTLQPMPMAIQPDTASAHKPSGPLRRTGPNVIFPPIRDRSDPRFDLIEDTLCTEIISVDGRASGARLRNLLTGTENIVTASVVAVCADTMRTPQLLWASRIRPEALGKHLNVHAFATGHVFVDIERVPVDGAAPDVPLTGEWCVASQLLPHSGQKQPFQGQIMTSPVYESDLTTVRGYSVGLSWYIPTEVQPENRVEFSDTRTDAAGLPQMSVHFCFSDHDREAIAAGLRSQRRAGDALGDFDPDRDSRLLSPGASLHHTGTVRMGAADDGTSVCDPDGRVWGTDNVFVAGNGAIPTSMTANTSLTGMITVVRAARGALKVVRRGAL